MRQSRNAEYHKLSDSRRLRDIVRVLLRLFGVRQVSVPPRTSTRQFDAYGGTQLDSEGIIEIEGATRDGHMEFLIPHRNRWRLPEVSLN